MTQELSSMTAALPTGAPNKLLFTFDEVSKILSISPGMLRKQARLRQLNVTRIGRCARISQAELLRLCKTDETQRLHSDSVRGEGTEKQ